jgi:Tol biopolymer transport system component
MREGPSFAISPGAEFLLMQTAQAAPGVAPVLEVATIEGRPIARFALPRNMSATGFTPDGRGLMAVRSNMVAPIRIVPVAGGPSRQVTEARGYDWPLGWSEDGSRLYVQTQANGHDAVLEIPVNGGPATQWVLPAGERQTVVPSPNGRHYLYSYSLTEPSSSGDLRTLVVQSLVDGNTRVVTRAAYVTPQSPSTFVRGPGGSWTNDGEFLYFERRGSRLELWTTPPEGPARLLRAFPSSYAGRTGFGVHGNRIAYTEKSGDSTTLLVAEGTNGRPRTVAKVAGSAAAPAWSHDGRWLAFDYYPPGEASRYSVLLLGVGPDGALTAAPRVLESGAQFGWQIEWLPDDHAVTVFGMTGQAFQTHVFLVSLREGERPIALTQDDPSTRWGYELSPDGRYVAYPAEIPRGSSIWRVDLGNVLQPAEGRRGTRR